MAVKERIISFLQNHPEGVDDDEIARILNLSSRQQANQICRNLESDGLVTRRERYGKIHNFWNGNSYSSVPEATRPVWPQEILQSQDKDQSSAKSHQESLPVVDIEKNVEEYIFGNNGSQGIKPQERYASFDYCFNYFRTFQEQGKLPELTNSQNIQTSCLHLGFYLASWGMLRGSTFLFNKSAKVYEPLIHCIAGAHPILWNIDTNCYSSGNIEILLDFAGEIRLALGEKNKASDTLVTKIMLGVFGNVPAFDSYFKKGFDVRSFGKPALQKIANFYYANSETIDNSRIFTLDFLTGQPTQRLYTRAKMIDMIFFIEGNQ